MDIITLPDELNIPFSKSIEVYNYQTSKKISKQQIVLNKNAFSFLLEGTKEIFFDNSSFSINNAQFLLMKSGNCLMTEKISDPQKNYHSILFFFSNEDVLNFIRKYKLNKTENYKYSSTYSFNYDNFIRGFVQSVLKISTFKKLIRQNLLSIKFDEIMLYLVELYDVDFLFSLINNNDNKTQKFIKTIECNKLNKLSIKELSFLTNMSVSIFKREFEKHFHSSPSKWFQEKRLEHAAFLLSNQAKRPSDIYEEIGYENLSNFIHAFKTKFGVTPKQHQSN